LNDVYFLDTQEKKKYQVLKDSKGVFLAAPQGNNDTIAVESTR